MIDLRLGDCLEVMKDIPDKSIDMILCDLPYGTTKCKWDVIIPFEQLWECYNKVIKDNGAIVLFGCQPFSSLLVNSNLKLFKYEWIWEKERGVNFLFANKQPMKIHENILVFYNKQPIYNPQMTIGNPSHGRGKREIGIESYEALGCDVNRIKTNKSTFKYPKTIQKFNSISRGKNIHPTQKPVDLLEYLIKTYTDENTTVLDNCMGSGSTGVACIVTGKDENYFKIAEQRINARTLFS